MTRPRPRFSPFLWSSRRALPPVLLPVLLLLLLLPACSYGNRMMRMTPFAGDELPDEDRVNAWPLFYKAGDMVVVLWPFFDKDEKGFALRPLIAREGEEWTVAWPLAGWNTETDEWWVLPAYRFENNMGFFPLFNTGNWNHVGPVWWTKSDEGEVDGFGVVPLYGQGESFRHVGPVYWFPKKQPTESQEGDKEGGEGGQEAGAAPPTPWGVFPVAHFGARGGWAVPAWWRKDDDGDLEHLGVLPLFFYKNDKDKGYRLLITPLGGRGWSEDDSKKLVNVLGPVFHYSSDGEESYVACAWPLFTMKEDADRSEWQLWPLAKYQAYPAGSSLSSLAGLFKHRTVDEGRGVRFAPLFSYTNEVGEELLDHLTLFAYHRTEKRSHMHIGSPLLFNYDRKEDGVEWNSLLKILDYESKGDESEFSFLWYLYRQKRKGEQVRRDFFPFATWDSGPERSGFSFLWRLFRYETKGDKTRGYAFFIPWGDHSEPEAKPKPTTHPSSRPDPRPLRRPIARAPVLRHQRLRR